MRINYLAGVILSVTTILGACGGEPTTCTISTTQDLRQGITKTAQFATGTDCEAMRLLAEQGQPLPTVNSDTIIVTAPKTAATPAPEAFSAPFVSGQKGQELIPTTNKQARVQELERKMGVDTKQSRDPFTSTIINPVPKLETLLLKPKPQPNLRAAVIVRTATRPVFIAPPPPPLPPDTRAAEGTKITGTVEVSGTVYVILTAFGEPTSRYVRAGQLVSNGRVLVKRIDTNSEPPIVVLQQNGVEVLRAVGQQVVASTDPTAAAPTAPTTVQPTVTATPLSIPFLVPPR